MSNIQTVEPIYAHDLGADGKSTAVSDPWPDLMVQKKGQFRWLHYDLATENLPAWLAEHTSQIVSNALTQSETRPSCDLEDDGILLNLRGINLTDDGAPEDMVSLRMWVSEGSILSIRKRKVFAIAGIDKAIGEGRVPTSIGKFLYTVTKGLTDRIEKVSLDLENRTEQLEDQILDDAVLADGIPEIEPIAPLRRSVIKLRRYIAPQKEALFHLVDIAEDYASLKERSLLREIANRTARIVEELDASYDRLGVLQDHLDGQIAERQNAASYVLSVVAAIFLPLGFLTGLFGVNVGGMPGMNSSIAFAILCISMVAIGALLWYLFRRIKWL